MSKISLSDGEWKLMKVLWEENPLTITQLVSFLKDETGWTKHTVITMLGRMEKKGAIYYEEGVKAKHFYPKVSQPDVTLEETKGFLDRVYDGSISLLVNTMVGSSSLSKKEINELYDILKKAEEESND